MAANDIYSKNWRHIHNISELLLGGAQADMDVETSPILRDRVHLFFSFLSFTSAGQKSSLSDGKW